MKNVFGLISVFLLFTGCVAGPAPVTAPSANIAPDIPISSIINFNIPNYGNINNVAIAVKDFETRGIIFVRSAETIDGNGNHTGSKITYEMLMLEAQKLGADDIINIKIDVNPVREVIHENGFNVTRTVYNYTATALAIKYTNALPIGSENSKDIVNVMNITNRENRTRGAAARPNVSTNLPAPARGSATFPSSFVGTWKRDNFDNTLTFTTDSVKSSSLEHYAELVNVSLNSYTLLYRTNNRRFTLTIRLVNDNIVIHGGTGTGQGNWNGIWRKQ